MSKSSKSGKPSKRPKKRSDQEALKKLQAHLEKIAKDLQALLSKKISSSDRNFLNDMAEDLKQLNEDTILVESISQMEPTADLIQHLLTTPMGAPFVSEKTLLEAAISFETQDPMQSDLYHLMDDFTIHSNLFNNQFLTVISSISEKLEKNSD